MSPHPSPLADTVANLRLATLALPARAWVPQAIHALILACLARIFGRLEEMIRLWQAGLLQPRMQRPSTVRTAPAYPGQREARQDSDSGHGSDQYAAARSATAHARIAEHAAQEASDHMETERQREASEAHPILLLSVSPPPCENSSLPARSLRARKPNCGRFPDLSHHLPRPGARCSEKCPSRQTPSRAHIVTISKRNL